MIATQLRLIPRARKPVRRDCHSIYLRACPRCNGDVCRREDQYGVWWSCIQCAHVVRYGETHDMAVTA